MINLIYLYPQYNYLGNEINICRIIDNEIKETIAIYGIDRKNILDIYITNTYTGENKIINKLTSINDIELVINKLKEKEYDIENQKNLFDVEKYILKNISI